MFEKYQQQASKTFKEHTPLDAHQAELLDWAGGLTGEAGEVHELFKHHIFSHEPLDKMRLAKELGDVLWYLAAICTTTGLELSAVAELNINKLAFRYQDQVYSDEASRRRASAEATFEDSYVYKCLEARILKKPAPMNIIFEGPDGAGKTTIAKLVAEKLAAEGFSYRKLNYEGDNKPDSSLEMLSSAINVIYDRFYYPSDIIYSRVKHEKESDEPMDWSTDYWKKYNLVRDELCNLNTVVIFTTASLGTLKERSAAWADDYIAVEDLEKIQGLYARWRQYIATLPIITFDCITNTGTPEEHAKHLVMCIHRAQAAFAGLPVDTFLSEEEKEMAAKLDAAEEETTTPDEDSTEA